MTDIPHPIIIATMIMLGLVPAKAPAQGLTFQQRWEPVQPLLDLPPLPLPPPKVNRELKTDKEDPPRVITIRTISIRAAEPVQSVETVDPAPVAPKARTIRRASLDLCQRHGMHKVHYGRTWRCRR